MNAVEKGVQLNTTAFDIAANEQDGRYICDLPRSLFVDGSNIKMGDRLVFGVAGVNKQFNARLVGAVADKHVMLIVDDESLDLSRFLIGLDNRLQRLTNNDTFAFNLAGQWAGDNLNSSDKYSLGGPNGVRAYPQGEASGDEGAIVNLELRHRFTPKLQGALFYDYGHLKINHDPFATGSNTRIIAGAGVGINAEIFRHLQFNSYVAWSTQGGTPVSEPASAERTPRIWVQLSSSF